MQVHMYKKLKFVKYIFIAAILFIPLELFAYEKINGRACYRFSDDETIVEARHVAEAMANALAQRGWQVSIRHRELDRFAD